jgi:hypothetical protein
MPDYQRSRIPRMRDLTLAEQDELIQRWRFRNALRTAYTEVIAALMQWVLDSPDIEKFVAAGHQALFTLIPSADLFERMVVNGYTPQEIDDAIKQNETPLNWMTPEELAAVVERVDMMLAYFATHDPGTFAQALIIYRVLGRVARENFVQRYGYPPEQSPIARVRMTGEKSEQKKLKPSNHQPQLFDGGNETP